MARLAPGATRFDGGPILNLNMCTGSVIWWPHPAAEMLPPSRHRPLPLFSTCSSVNYCQHLDSFQVHRGSGQIPPRAWVLGQIVRLGQQAPWLHRDRVEILDSDPATEEVANVALPPPTELGYVLRARFRIIECDWQVANDILG